MHKLRMSLRNGDPSWVQYERALCDVFATRCLATAQAPAIQWVGSIPVCCGRGGEGAGLERELVGA